MGVLLEVIRQRLTQQLQLLDCGDIPPPGPRLRLEGLMEAAVLNGEADKEALQTLVAALYKECLGESIEERLGQDWECWHPFPQIPAFAARAPVSPSTSD